MHVTPKIIRYILYKCIFLFCKAAGGSRNFLHPQGLAAQIASVPPAADVWGSVCSLFLPVTALAWTSATCNYLNNLLSTHQLLRGWPCYIISISDPDIRFLQLMTVIMKHFSKQININKIISFSSNYVSHVMLFREIFSGYILVN